MIAHRPITGRTVLIGMIAFFGVIISVNMVFVYFALDSWPGLTTDSAYEDGLAYNETLAKAERQAVTGWRSDVAVSGGILTLRMRDREGGNLSAMKAEVKLVRPAREGLDLVLALSETTPGVYQAETGKIAAGRWHVEVRAVAANDRQYFMVHELMVDP